MSAPLTTRNPNHEILYKALSERLKNLELDRRIEDAKETSDFWSQIPVEAEYPYALLDSCMKGEYDHVKRYLQETKNPGLFL
ncbi:hypothetical protein COCMIDRAFT_55502, partial [Bipolaris oryzae ATCC 44560]